MTSVVHTGDYSRGIRRQSPFSATTGTVAEFGDCRPKRRLSPKTAIVAEFGDCRQKRRLLPDSATVAENGDCCRIRRQFSRQCGQGFTRHHLYAFRGTAGTDYTGYDIGI